MPPPRWLASSVNILYTKRTGSKREDVAMAKVRSLFAGSGLTLDELGRRMGYPAATARQSAWQFLWAGAPNAIRGGPS